MASNVVVLDAHDADKARLLVALAMLLDNNVEGRPRAWVSMRDGLEYRRYGIRITEIVDDAGQSLEFELVRPEEAHPYKKPEGGRVSDGS